MAKALRSGTPAERLRGLGKLEPYTRPRTDGGAEPEPELDWFMGFIRGARLRLSAGVTGLDDLLG